LSALEPVARRDYLGVALFTLILYAIVLAAGGPLTLHEGVLSQTSKAMLANHDWLVPRYGDAPWLERPPLPQWISCVICAVIGHCDAEWNVRIGPALAGLTTVLLTTWLAGRLFGRGIGVLSGLALATMYNFVRYSTLAEADIFLAPIVAGALAAFAHSEVLSEPEASAKAPGPPSLTLQALTRVLVGTRPWCVLAFFVFLGMTNLVKGLVFGMVIVTAPVGVYLLWNDRKQKLLYFLLLFAWAFLLKLLLYLAVKFHWEPLLARRGWFTLIGMAPLGLYFLWQVRLYARYAWVWGWLITAAIALPWPLLVLDAGYTDAVEVWKFDLFGRLSGNYLGEPPWYYFECLTWVPQPWTLFALIGMAITWLPAWRDGSRPLRFVWCWAWLPILVFSLSDGKHHHYMLHYLAPFAILAAHGVVWLWRQAADRWSLERPGFALTGSFACLFILYAGGFIYKGQYLHGSRDDTNFLHEARRAVPLDQPLMINSADEALEGLRMQFYLGDSVYFLHNLSFVLDDRVPGSDVYVVTRYNRLKELEKYGRAEALHQCKRARRETSPADRWTLFRLHLRDDLPRKNAHVRISPMQAMYRADGPRLD
jgi:4-amino-4-deoxy-L-arabinose transferase-like glycosyltransferase